jgi:hypothetical protein
MHRFFVISNTGLYNFSHHLYSMYFVMGILAILNYTQQETRLLRWAASEWVKLKYLFQHGHRQYEHLLIQMNITCYGFFHF